MCKICSEWQSGKLTAKEAWHNLLETEPSSDEEEMHYFEIAETLADNMLEEMLEEETDEG